MNVEKSIPLNLVELALHSRKIAAVQRRADPSAGCRWAAMSAHTATNECRRGARQFHYSVKPMMTPMFAGYLASVVERVRSTEGLQGVRRTWGMGYRAMKASTSSEVMR